MNLDGNVGLDRTLVTHLLTGLRRRLSYANVMVTLALFLAAFFLALTGGAMAGAKYLTANDPQATLASAPRRSDEQDAPLAVALDGSRDLTNQVAAMRVARL